MAHSPCPERLDRVPSRPATNPGWLPLRKQNQAKHPTQASNPSLVCSWSQSKVIQEMWGGRRREGEAEATPGKGSVAQTGAPRALPSSPSFQGPVFGCDRFDPSLLSGCPPAFYLLSWGWNMGSCGGPTRGGAVEVAFITADCSRLLGYYGKAQRIIKLANTTTYNFCLRTICFISIPLLYFEGSFFFSSHKELKHL